MRGWKQLDEISRTISWLEVIRSHSARPTISENASLQSGQTFNRTLLTPLIGSRGWIVSLKHFSHSYWYNFTPGFASFSSVILSHLLKFLCDDAIWNDSSQRLTNLCLIIRPKTTIVYRYTPRRASKVTKKCLFGLVQ